MTINTQTLRALVVFATCSPALPAQHATALPPCGPRVHRACVWAGGGVWGGRSDLCTAGEEMWGQGIGEQRGGRAGPLVAAMKLGAGGQVTQCD